MKIYVGNLSRDVTDTDLKEAFSAFGAVDSVTMIKDKFSGLPKGFAFIEMPVRTEAEAAVTGLHRKELKGQSMDVNEARPKVDRRQNRGRGNWNGGGRKGGGGGERRTW